MPTVIGHHNITKDTKHWLSSPRRKELFGALGITNIRTFVDPQNPKRVALMMDVPDMDKLSAMMQSKAAADAMAFDGVVPKPTGDPGRIERVSIEKRRRASLASLRLVDLRPAGALGLLDRELGVAEQFLARPGLRASSRCRSRIRRGFPAR